MFWSIHANLLISVLLTDLQFKSVTGQDTHQGGRQEQLRGEGHRGRGERAAGHPEADVVRGEHVVGIEINPEKLDLLDLARFGLYTITYNI